MLEQYRSINSVVPRRNRGRFDFQEMRDPFLLRAVAEGQGAICVGLLVQKSPKTIVIKHK